MGIRCVRTKNQVEVISLLHITTAAICINLPADGRDYAPNYKTAHSLTGPRWFQNAAKSLPKRERVGILGVFTATGQL